MIFNLQSTLIAAGVSAVVAFGAGYKVSSLFSDSKILKLQNDNSTLVAEKTLANDTAETRRNELAVHAKKSKEVADAALESLLKFATRPPVITERVKRVNIPVGGLLCPDSEGGDSRARENSSQPTVIGDAYAALRLPDGDYISGDEYRIVRDSLMDRILKYRKQHKAHLGLSEVVETLACIQLTE